MLVGSDQNCLDMFIYVCMYIYEKLFGSDLFKSLPMGMNIIIENRVFLVRLDNIFEK